MAVPFAAVEVVVAAVPGPGSDQGESWSTLDAGERARAARFRDAIDSRRYVAAHGLLRAVIAARDGASPGDVKIGRDRSSVTGVSSAVIAVPPGTQVFAERTRSLVRIEQEILAHA
jgi:hypothetical protein